MIPQISPLRQVASMDGQHAPQGMPLESGSVLSSLLSAPTSEIKAAAALHQKVFCY